MTYSFTLIYNSYYDTMFKVCLKYFPWDDAKDLVQEGFIKVYNKINSFNNNGSLEGWLKCLFRNLCLDRLRFLKNKPTTISVEDSDDIVEDSDDDDIEMIYNHSNVLNIIDNLSPRYQEVLKLRLLDNKSNKFISEHLGISESSVRSCFSRGCKLIKNINNK